MEINKADYLVAKMKSSYEGVKNDTVEITEEEYRSISKYKKLIDDEEDPITKPDPIYDNPLQENEFNTITYISYEKLKISDEVGKWEYITDDDFDANIISHEFIQENIEEPGQGKIIFDNNLHNIPNNAFENNKLLLEMHLPNIIKKIGNNVFYDCILLENINIPNYVESIGNSCFFGCVSLTSIVLHNNVTLLGSHCFSQCSALKSIQLSNKLTEIKNNTFSLCRSLSQINIPDSVTSIGGSAFSGCNLSSIDLSTINIHTIDSFAFSENYGLLSIKLPNTIKIIETYAFSNTKIESIIIPESTLFIGQYSLASIDLKIIIINSNHCKIPNNPFGSYDMRYLESIYVPDEALEYYTTETYLSHYIDKVKPLSELPNE